MIPQIADLLELKDKHDWLKNPLSKRQLLLDALELGLILGKEMAWATEQYLMGLYREEMLALLTGSAAESPLRITSDPVFRGMLRFDVLANHLFEGVLVRLRKNLAAGFVQGQAVDFELVSDLALHFHFTGFISGISREEAPVLEALAQRHRDQPSLHSYLVLSLYQTPQSNDEIVVEGMRHASHAQLISEHQEGADLQRLARQAEPGEDTIGDQYTSFPYPLWRAPRAFMALLHQRLQWLDGNRTPPLRRLIAGCGTGRQPLISLTRNPTVPVRIDAIDISPASLHYARCRLVDFTSWVTLAQADIAQWCKARPREYDNIECVGVLHHTPDDRAYLQAMIHATKPGGKITLGLYSKAGREEILEARALSKSLDFGGDQRRLRAKIIQSDMVHKAALMSRRDFYTRSEFKDLVNNNREKNYDSADLEALLAGLPVQIVWFKGLEISAPAPNAEILQRAGLLEKKDAKAYAGMFLFTLVVTG